MTARSVPVCLLAIAAGVAALHAATIIPPTFEQMVAGAEVIVRGQVVNVVSTWRDSAADAPIVTKVTVHVEQILKGQPGSVLELEFLGGTVGDVGLLVSDMPQFTVGERDVLFINTAGHPMSPLVGVFAGRWMVHADALTGREFMTTAFGTPITSLSDADPRPARSLSTMRRAGPPLSVSELEGRIREQVRR